MAWLKDIAWIKVGISAAVALVGFFLVNGLSYWMITRSRRCPTDERVKSIQAFNASVILYLAIDFLLLVNVLLAQDIGSTIKPRAAFFAIFLASTFLSMMISRPNIPLTPRLVPWIWLLLSASTAAILLTKGWFGAPDTSYALLAARADLRLVPLVISLLGSWWLVVSLHYDLRFDTSIDPHHYFQHTASNQAVSIFKEFIKTLTPALLLGFLALFIASKLAPGWGWSRFPALPPGLPDLARSLPGAPHHLYWAFVSGFAAAILLIKALRCLDLSPKDFNEDPAGPELQDLRPEPSPPLDPPVLDPRPGHYDVFISYKSQDVLTARQVTEQLIASGVKAWFAEYQIPAAEQLRIQNAAPEESQRRIDTALQQGLTAAGYGLAFTNDRYASSAYCSQEIEHLLRHCGPGHVCFLTFKMIPL